MDQQLTGAAGQAEPLIAEQIRMAKSIKNTAEELAGRTETILGRLRGERVDGPPPPTTPEPAFGKGFVDAFARPQFGTTKALERIAIALEAITLII